MEFIRQEGDPALPSSFQSKKRHKDIDDVPDFVQSQDISNSIIYT